MTAIDWIILSIYFIGLIAMSIYLGKGQENQADYYVGGRSLPWWAVGLSTMATQTSAVSFISIPAFVALKAGGGLRILQNEFALPLAMIFIMILLIPLFRKLELISVYEYLESRFNSATRSLLAGVFIIARTLATGVGVYAVAIVLSVVLGMDPVYTVILIGVVTVIYDTIGGMKAVVYSDVVQMGILLLGIVICIYYSVDIAGGWAAVMAYAGENSSKMVSVDFTKHGLGDSSEYNFWAMLIGGFFLYASYYGCDQSQTQRELSAPSIEDTKNSLVFNGFFRFPLVILYCAMGVTLGAAIQAHPDFNSIMTPYLEAQKYDYALPLLILNYVPVGLKAVIFAAILAAAMSSLDSGINSLSAVFMRDFFEKYINKESTERQYLFFSRASTVMFGAICITTAIVLTQMQGLRTVVEMVNQVGSMFYGPILATFLLGVLFRRITSSGVIVGLLAGVLFNMYLWLFQPSVSWLWWNAFGCIVSMIAAHIVSFFDKPPSAGKLRGMILWDTDLIIKEKLWIPRYMQLFGYFAAMVILAHFLPLMVFKESLVGIAGRYISALWIF